jgi:hypothetical protein
MGVPFVIGLVGIDAKYFASRAPNAQVFEIDGVTLSERLTATSFDGSSFTRSLRTHPGRKIDYTASEGTFLFCLDTVNARLWRQSRNVPLEQSRNVPIHARRNTGHSLVRHHLASRPAVKAALRRQRRGLDGTSPRCARLSSHEGMAGPVLAVSRNRGRFYFASQGTFLFCPDTVNARLDTALSLRYYFGP